MVNKFGIGNEDEPVVYTWANDIPYTIVTIAALDAGYKVRYSPSSYNTPPDSDAESLDFAEKLTEGQHCYFGHGKMHQVHVYPRVSRHGVRPGGRSTLLEAESGTQASGYARCFRPHPVRKLGQQSHER